MLMRDPWAKPTAIKVHAFSVKSTIPHGHVTSLFLEPPCMYIRHER
jgi:hypothetical protein